MNIKLTIFFDSQFWIGIFERNDTGMLQTSKVVFGSEPMDYEEYDFVLNNFYRLTFGVKVNSMDLPEVKISPKRMQRMIKQETKDRGIGTKAQLAMKISQEAKKIERKKINKNDQELLEEQKYLQKQLKKKEKKKGH